MLLQILESDDNNFYYALRRNKGVGYEAISNIIKERIENGKFKSINDFIKRVNPKDINKLQLEGLVKAGAFDNLNNNRQALFNSIPNFILKSQKIFLIIKSQIKLIYFQLQDEILKMMIL